MTLIRFMWVTSDAILYDTFDKNEVGHAVPDKV